MVHQRSVCVHQHGRHRPGDGAKRCLLPSQLHTAPTVRSSSLTLRSQPLSMPVSRLLWQLLQLRPQLRPQLLWQLRHLVRQLELLPPELGVVRQLGLACLICVRQMLHHLSNPSRQKQHRSLIPRPWSPPASQEKLLHCFATKDHQELSPFNVNSRFCCKIRGRGKTTCKKRRM